MFNVQMFTPRVCLYRSICCIHMSLFTHTLILSTVYFCSLLSLLSLLCSYYIIYCYIDINECSTLEHDCSQLCHNTNGSYQCMCRSGFTLKDRTACEGQPFLFTLYFIGLVYYTYIFNYFILRY